MLLPWIAVVFVCLLIWKLCVVKRDPKEPPGPGFRLPLIGQLLYVAGNDPMAGYSKLRKKYGDIFSFELGPFKAIVVSEFEALKEMMNDDRFSYRTFTEGRIKRFLMKMKGGTGMHGLISSSGEEWREQRRFALRHLRDFGFGKARMDEIIMDEVRELSDELRSQLKEKDELRLDQTFNISVINVLWTIVSGRRFDLKDNEQRERIHKMNESFSSSGAQSLAMVLAFLVPESLSHLTPQNKKFFATNKMLYDWFQEAYDEHLKSFDPNNLRDLVDVYILQRQEATESSSFYGETGKWNYLAGMNDLFLAGSETTSTALTYSIMYLTLNPDVQAKAQADLDEVVGRSRLPSASDRDQLPYIDALMSEILRCGNIAPFAVQHANRDETEFRGFKIPRNSMIVPNLSEVMWDPANFPEPKKFDPTRFICKETGKFKPHPALIYFGIGKRECLGKTLAKAEFFLFLSSLLHQFTFKPAASGPPDPENVKVSVTRFPLPFTVKVLQRD